MKRLQTLLVAGMTCCLLGALAPAPAQADPIADDFRQRCYSCHTIGGGRLTGPDLKNVVDRKDREWLLNFIVDPAGVLASGDPYALKLQEDAKGAVMPNIMGMTKERANLLLQLIEAESALEQSNFQGLSFSEEPFTPAEVARGQKIFTGEIQLKNGGAACMSCHTVRGMGGLGGGALGPDLTTVYERLGGRKSLGSWLLSPATVTMQSQYKDKTLQSDEIMPLVAYLESTAQSGGVAEVTPRLNFFLLGLAGAVLGLVTFDFIWGFRFRGVRQPLVRHAEQQKGKHNDR